MSPHGVGVLAIVVTSILWGTTGTAAALAPGISGFPEESINSRIALAGVTKAAE